jgi:hypothetical protein
VSVHDLIASVATMILVIAAIPTLIAGIIEIVSCKVVCIPAIAIASEVLVDTRSAVADYQISAISAIVHVVPAIAPLVAIVIEIVSFKVSRVVAIAITSEVLVDP